MSNSNAAWNVYSAIPKGFNAPLPKSWRDAEARYASLPCNSAAEHGRVLNAIMQRFVRNITGKGYKVEARALPLRYPIIDDGVMVRTASRIRRRDTTAPK